MLCISWDETSLFDGIESQITDFFWCLWDRFLWNLTKTTYIVIRSNLSKTDFTRQISTFMKIVNFKNELQIVNCKHCVYSWKLRNEKTESNKLRRFTSKVSWIWRANVSHNFLVLTWNFVKTTVVLDAERLQIKR